MCLAKLIEGTKVAQHDFQISHYSLCDREVDARSQRGLRSLVVAISPCHLLLATYEMNVDGEDITTCNIMKDDCRRSAADNGELCFELTDCPI